MYNWIWDRRHATLRLRLNPRFEPRYLHNQRPFPIFPHVHTNLFLFASLLVKILAVRRDTSGHPSLHRPLPLVVSVRLTTMDPFATLVLGWTTHRSQSLLLRVPEPLVVLMGLRSPGCRIEGAQALGCFMVVGVDAGVVEEVVGWTFLLCSICATVHFSRIVERNVGCGRRRNLSLWSRCSDSVLIG